MTLLADIWSILKPRQRRGILAMQAVSLVMAVSTATGIAAIAPFFAVLGDPLLTEHNSLLHWLYARGGFASHGAFVVALGLAFTTLVVSANAINVLGFLAMNRLALRIGNELQTTLFTEYLSRPYVFHTTANSTTLFSNVVYETNRISHGILQNGFALVTNLVTAGLIVLSILLLRPALAIAIVLGLAGGYFFIYVTVRNRLLRIGFIQSDFAIERAQIVNESLGAIRDIIILQVRDFFSGRFERASHGFLRCVAEAQVVGQSPRYVMECVAAAGLVSVALLLGSRGGGAGSWLGLLTFLAFAAYRLLPALHQVFIAIVQIRADRAALDLLAPDLRSARARQRTAPSAGRGSTDPFWIARPRNEIRLQGVSYSHGRDLPWVLHDVSLRIPARAAVGIVGANGAGKTTLLDVIAGLRTPTAGDIEIDGRVLDDGNRAAWQTCLAYVPQHIVLSDSSIARNIAFGVAADAIDRPRLLEAARLAQLDEFVMTLPHGYEQRVGDRGVAVSGGQRQRIGIARALYRQASVLLLDEATNALDGLTAHELMMTLRQLRGRYTVVLIAHGMNAVRACDVIFHLEQGKIVASGTYEGLLESSAVFRRMAGVA